MCYIENHKYELSEGFTVSLVSYQNTENHWLEKSTALRHITVYLADYISVTEQPWKISNKF